MSYAVQVQWLGDETWTYVTDPASEGPLIYHGRQDAERAAEHWRIPGNETAVRVVEV